MLGEPEEPQCVILETPGEPVPPFPVCGRPRPVLFREVSRDKGEVLVVGICLCIRQMDHIGHFPHSPRITRDCSTPACKYPLAVLLHLFLRHSLEPHVSISARIDIFDEGHIFFPVVVFRLGDRDVVVLVSCQAYAVVIRLDGIVTLVCSPCLIRSVLPPAVDLAGARLRKF